MSELPRCRLQLRLPLGHSSDQRTAHLAVLRLRKALRL